MPLDPSFAKLATATADITRTPALASGKRGAPAAVVSGLAITPPVPIQPTQPQDDLGFTAQEYETWTQDTAASIRPGDLLTTGGSTYRVAQIFPFPFDGNTRWRIVYQVPRA